MDLELFSNDKSEDYWAKLSRYIKPADKTAIKLVYDFAQKVHLGQKRDSGADFFSHPVWVARTMAQMDVGVEAIEAALLHDCIEDSNVSIEKIASKFGDEVALLVEGLTEVRKKVKRVGIYRTNIEVFKRFLFSSVDDVRVLIIRLVDKLHNGMTIEFLSKERQIKYAKGVLGIYGPVAEYVGLHFFKKRLEDIAFSILYPKTAKRFKKILTENKTKELEAQESIKRTIEKLLKVNRINGVEIQSRIKGLYSTYLKVKNKKYGKKRGFKDRVGIRILCQTISDCYVVLGLLHAKYRYLADEFNDYISVPKENGYQSIQTTLKWTGKITAEVQIRTFEMHEFNEFGPASHLAYKYGKGQGGVGYEWVKDLVLWQKSDKGIKNYRIKVLTHFIYVFTPKGDTLQLPKGASGLDFAYRIHSYLGNCCQGIKINGKIAKMGAELKTGDTVEVLKGKKINANESWLDLAKTVGARDHIRQAIARENDRMGHE